MSIRFPNIYSVSLSSIEKAVDDDNVWPGVKGKELLEGSPSRRDGFGHFDFKIKLVKTLAFLGSLKITG